MLIHLNSFCDFSINNKEILWLDCNLKKRKKKKDFFLDSYLLHLTSLKQNESKIKSNLSEVSSA